jgi:hypothetical protein
MRLSGKVEEMYWKGNNEDSCSLGWDVKRNLQDMKLQYQQFDDNCLHKAC